MEPAVLRFLSRPTSPEVKFVSFEYAGNVWREPLSGVVKDLYAAGYFCFLMTQERLFPVSGPFWDDIYELPMWSNLFCGRDGDPDLEALVQLHSGAVGLWPRMPRTYLAGFAGDDPRPTSLVEARHLCTDLGEACAGVTCEVAVGDESGAPGACTARAGLGGMRVSPGDGALDTAEGGALDAPDGASDAAGGGSAMITTADGVLNTDDGGGSVNTLVLDDAEVGDADDASDTASGVDADLCNTACPACGGGGCVCAPLLTPAAYAEVHCQWMRWWRLLDNSAAAATAGHDAAAAGLEAAGLEAVDVGLACYTEDAAGLDAVGLVATDEGLDGAAGLDVPATGHAAGVVAAGADNAASEIYTCAAGDMPLAQLLQMPGFLSFYNRTSDDSSSNDGISAATSMPIGDPPSVEDPPARRTSGSQVASEADSAATGDAPGRNVPFAQAQAHLLAEVARDSSTITAAVAQPQIACGTDISQFLRCLARYLGETCANLKYDLRKVGRKVGGTKTAHCSWESLPSQICGSEFLASAHREVYYAAACTDGLRLRNAFCKSAALLANGADADADLRADVQMLQQKVSYGKGSIVCDAFGHCFSSLQSQFRRRASIFQGGKTAAFGVARGQYCTSVE
ncbi:unnamed protein product [Polarella glacialis]|uniref:Uncharacterized protein n=1 Tax=Polarella glacialis TaxID=89957 RepID=A0A813I7K8_POLGL|nr:unnamed protein product [Polarella glacialis]